MNNHRGICRCKTSTLWVRTYLQNITWRKTPDFVVSDIITLSFGIFMGLFAVLSKYDLRSHGLYSLPNISFMQLLGYRLKINGSLVFIIAKYRWDHLWIYVVLFLIAKHVNFLSPLGVKSVILVILTAYWGLNCRHCSHCGYSTRSSN
jgi:hypothetical protein